MENPAVQGTTDQVDVNFTVTEKPTGNILLGAGFGSGTGLVLSGSVVQQNIFGSGKHVGLQISSGKLSSIYSLSYTDPYFTQDGVSVGYDLTHRKVDAASSNLGQYVIKTTGGGVRFGVPVTEIDTIQYGLGIEQTHMTTFVNSPLYYINYVNKIGRAHV